jgi:hypothetical protein
VEHLVFELAKDRGAAESPARAVHADAILDSVWTKEGALVENSRLRTESAVDDRATAFSRCMEVLVAL